MNSQYFFLPTWWRARKDNKAIDSCLTDMEEERINKNCLIQKKQLLEDGPLEMPLGLYRKDYFLGLEKLKSFESRENQTTTITVQKKMFNKKRTIWYDAFTTKSIKEAKKMVEECGYQNARMLEITSPN